MFTGRRPFFTRATSAAISLCAVFTPAFLPCVYVCVSQEGRQDGALAISDQEQNLFMAFEWRKTQTTDEEMQAKRVQT